MSDTEIVPETKPKRKTMPRTDKQKANLAKAVQELREKREKEWEEYLETKKKQADTVPKIDIKPEPPKIDPPKEIPQYVTKADIESLLDQRFNTIFKPSEPVQQIQIVHKRKPKKQVVYVSDTDEEEEPVIVKRKPKPNPTPTVNKRDALLSYLMS